MMHLMIQPSFEADFAKIMAEIQHNYPQAAERFYWEVENAIHELKEYPRRYALIPESPYNMMDIHWFRIGSYHVFYKIEEDTIRVFRMLHIRASLHDLLTYRQ